MTDLSWKEPFIPESDTLPQQVWEIINYFVDLPHREIQSRLLAAAILTPTKLATRLPIVFVHGAAGSGKSQLLSVLSYLTGSPILSSASTYAALRNAVQAQQSQKYLFIDNLNRQFFDDERKRDCFLTGYDRKTAQVQIAGSTGSNLIYNTFALRVVSSVLPLYSYPGLTELKRRTLPVKTQKTDFLVEEPSDYCFAGLQRDFQDFVSSPEYCEKWIASRKYLKSIRSLLVEYSVDFLLDFLASLLAGELASKAELLGFCQHYRALLGTAETTLQQAVQVFLEAAERNGRCQIGSQEITSYLIGLQKAGYLDSFGSGEVQETLAALGWQLTLDWKFGAQYQKA